MLKLFIAGILLAQTYIVPGRLRPAVACTAPDETTNSADLLWWVDTTSVTESGGEVSEMTDQSAAGNDWTQATGSKQPSLVTNAFGTGRDGIQGDNDATDDNVALASTKTLSGDLSAYYLVKHNSSDASVAYLTADGANNSFRINTAENLVIRCNASTTTLTTGGVISNAETHLVEFHRDGSSNWTVYVDGVDVTNGTPNNVEDCTQLYMLMSTNGGGESDIIIGASVTYTSDHTSSDDRDCIRDYYDAWWND